MIGFSTFYSALAATQGISKSLYPNLPRTWTNDAGKTPIMIFALFATIALGVGTYFLIIYLRRKREMKALQITMWQTFNRECKEKRLSEIEINLLRDLIRSRRINTPDKLIKKLPLFDESVTNELSEHEAKGTSREEVGALLNAFIIIREKVHFGGAFAYLPLESSRDIKPDTIITTHSESGHEFSGNIVSNSDDGFSVSLKGPVPISIAFEKWHKIEGHFSILNDASYKFESEIYAIGEGVPLIHITHADLKRHETRANARLSMDLPIEFFIISSTSGHIDNDDNSNQKLLVKSKGAIRDFSISGCGIRTLFKLNEGDYIGISMPWKKSDLPIELIARVMTAAKLGTSRIPTYHVMLKFTDFPEQKEVAIMLEMFRLQRDRKTRF